MMLENTSGSSACNNQNVLPFSSCQEEVSEYLSSKDEDKVRKIALDHLSDLTSIDDFSMDRNLLVQSMVLSIFQDPDADKKVLRVNNETVGFITYFMNESFFGKYATIEHLAVDKDHQKKGYGSVLLRESLKDLKEKDADWAELSVSNMHPIPFYERHEFTVVKYPVAKYKSAGKLAITLKESSHTGSLRSLNRVRMHKTALFPYAYMAVIALGLSLWEKFEETPKTKIVS